MIRPDLNIDWIYEIKKPYHIAAFNNGGSEYNVLTARIGLLAAAKNRAAVRMRILVERFDKWKKGSFKNIRTPEDIGIRNFMIFPQM